MRTDSSISSGKVLYFFFDAMLNGYASGAKAETNMPEPGWKGYFYKTGELRCVDTWRQIADNNQISGLIVIHWKSIPVWVMRFNGWYKELATPTLKEALLWNFSRRIFEGARGPRTYAADGLVYKNLASQNLFTDFHGMETISSHTGELLGTHRYQGMWLIG